MKALSVIALIAMSGSVCIAADLPRSTPESQGVSSSAVLAFIDAADSDIDALHSFMLLRHGAVVAEGWWSPYNAASPHMLYSLSKSFTSTAVGLAIAEGKLSLDDAVLKFFPEHAPAEPSDNLKAMRVHDLLRMSTGQQTEPPRTPDEPWTKTFLAHPVPFKPGTHFLYNTSGTYMLSAIVQKATGQTVLDYLGPRLFDPLGIERPTWERSPAGISAGGYGLSVRTPDEPWTKTFLAHPVPFKPGTHFLYNTSGTYMLSAIVQKATGQTVLDYLGPRLFSPLGIENPTWETSPAGISAGGYGLSVRTEDIARLGQLYLQKGRWQGRQLVPAAWVEAASARQTANGSNPNSDWDQGYGYQFWRCRHGIYRGDGAFGQYCIVLPEQDAVIAITSGVRNMQTVLDLVWDKLLPALKDAPLAPDNAARMKLERRLRSLSLRTPEGAGSGAAVLGKTYGFPANERQLEAIALESAGSDDAVTLVARIDGAERRIACGHGGWRDGRIAWGRLDEQPVAAAGAWTEADTYTAKLCFYETPHIVTIRLKFAGQQLQYNAEANVSFGPTREPELTGRAR